MPVLLSDEELNALVGITDIQYRLYIAGIRRYMDYKTGVVGIKRKISYQSLSEEIYIEPIKGVKNTGSKSRQQIRRAVKALEKAGLIAIKSTCENLILKCLLAKTDELHSKQGRHKADTLADTQADTVEQSPNPVKIDTVEADIQESRHTGRPPQNDKADTPPLSGKDTKLNYIAPPDFLSAEENKFLNLFTDLKLSLKLAGDLKAITTAKALVQAGVTLDVASEALKIKLAAYEGTRTPHPSYFKDAIINYKRDLEAIKQPLQETKNVRSAADRKAAWQPNSNPNDRVRKEIDDIPDEWEDEG